MAVEIVSDTTHYLPRELVERHRIRQVSLYVNWQGRADREADMQDFEAYYDHLADAEELPTTSQPSVGDFLAVYEPLLERGDEIVSIHIAGGISGTVRAAEQARDELVERGIAPARVEVVDSGTAAGGLGAVVLAAVNARDASVGVAEVAAAARAVQPEVRILFAVDTLEYLRRGGRIGTAQAWLGSALRIKPILAFEGELVPVERVRTSGRAFDRLVEHLRDCFEDGLDLFFIQHVRDPERAGRLVEAGRAIFGSEPLFVSEIGPVIGTHVGPGLLGAAAAPKRLVERA